MASIRPAGPEKSKVSVSLNPVIAPDSFHSGDRHLDPGTRELEAALGAGTREPLRQTRFAGGTAFVSPGFGVERWIRRIVRVDQGLVQGALRVAQGLRPHQQYV